MIIIFNYFAVREHEIRWARILGKGEKTDQVLLESGQQNYGFNKKEGKNRGRVVCNHERTYLSHLILFN